MAKEVLDQVAPFVFLTVVVAGRLRPPSTRDDRLDVVFGQTLAQGLGELYPKVGDGLR